MFSLGDKVIVNGLSGIITAIDTEENAVRVQTRNPVGQKIPTTNWVPMSEVSHR